MADELELIDGQKAAAQAEAEKKEPIVISDELWNEEFKKRMGAGTDEFIKKSEQVKVLTEAEKAEIEEKKNKDALIVALEKNWVKKTDYDNFLTADATDRVQIARNKFIEDHPELGEKAGAKFDKIFKVTEDDEISNGEDGEKELFIPNEDKKIALQWAAKIGDEVINNKFAPIKSLGKRHEAYLEELAVVEKNTELVKKAVGEIPRNVDYKVGEDVYTMKFDETEMLEAVEMVLKSDAVKNKSLTAEEVKGNAALFLQAKNIQKLVTEVATAARIKGEESEERGKSGITPAKVDNPGTMNAKMEFLKEVGIKV